MHKDFEIRNNLNINCKHVELFGWESNDKKKNTLFNVLYMPPNGQIEQFEKLFKTFIQWKKNPIKIFILQMISI